MGKHPLQLHPDVVAAIRAGRKIEAIKRLREAEGLGLKEAKQAVDAYIQSDPELREQHSGSSGVVLLVVLILAAYGAYRLLA